MSATMAEIEAWFQGGVEQGATHMAVFCDTFDWTDYPAFFTAADPDDARAQIQADEDRLMEVYHLRSDMNTQTRTRARQHNYTPLET